MLEVFAPALTEGRYEEAYGLIHPAQRELFTVEQLVACYDARDLGPVELVEVEGETDTTHAVDGTDLEDQPAVELEVVYENSDGDRNTVTNWVMEVDGELYVVFQGPEDVVAGDC